MNTNLKYFPFRQIGLTCFFLLLSCSLASSQGLSIDSCYAMALRNYPLVKQMSLIEKTKEFSVSNASKGYLPQVNFAGQATYQSDVTKISIPIPVFSVPETSKDQYKIYGEINQSLTDAFIIKQQKELIKANSTSEVEKVEVELYKLKERINQLFFGILLIDAQIQQAELLKNDIKSGIKKTEASISNGVALKINADMLHAELLKAEQKTIELKAGRKGFTDMLEVFINQPVNENTPLVTPPVQIVSSQVNRPELRLFEVQKKSFDVQDHLIRVKNIPKLNLFFQGGYGRPALNVLNNDFDTYYIGGVRFNWNLSGFYTAGKERKIIDINKNTVDVQKEVFLFNTSMTMKQQSSEMAKLTELINSDQEVIALRENIKITAANQLENGIITSIDYLTYVNAEDQAKQNLLLHKIQWLSAQYSYRNTSGN